MGLSTWTLKLASLDSDSLRFHHANCPGALSHSTAHSLDQDQGCVEPNWRVRSKKCLFVTFWRKWVFGQYEDFIGWSIFWQNFEWYDPSPARVTHEWIWGQILKMLETCFYACENNCYVVRITKIYSLSYVGCMVEEQKEQGWGAKGHQKVNQG